VQQEVLFANDFLNLFAINEYFRVLRAIAAEDLAANSAVVTSEAPVECLVAR
jgi:hypothetical protein